MDLRIADAFIDSLARVTGAKQKAEAHMAMGSHLNNRQLPFQL